MQAATVDVDVRDVEPKDRYERIMGAYEALDEGESIWCVIVTRRAVG